VNLSKRISTLSPEITAAAGRRWRLFPVEANGKLPLVKEWQTIATSDQAQLEAWAAQWPSCNWGLATGKASGCLLSTLMVWKAALHWKN
jgi:hypothetical protein